MFASRLTDRVGAQDAADRPIADGIRGRYRTLARAVETWETAENEPSLRSVCSLIEVLDYSFEDRCFTDDDPPRKGGSSKNASGRPALCLRCGA